MTSLKGITVRRILIGVVLAISLAFFSSEARAQNYNSQGPFTISGTSCSSPFAVRGFGTLEAEVNVTGTFTLNVQLAVDSIYTAIPVIDSTDTSPALAANITADGKYQVNTGGFRWAKVCGVSGAGNAIVSLGASVTGGGGASGGGGGPTSNVDVVSSVPLDIATLPAITGTVTANAGTNLNTSALLTTTAHDAAFGTAGTADAQVRSVQGIAGGVSLPVTCTSGCGGSGGVSQGDNTAVTDITGIGALFDTTPPAITDGNVGLPRMSTDRYLYTIFPSAQAVTVSTFPDNEPINVAQINGVTPLMGAGNTGTGSPRVTEASDSILTLGVGATSDAAATVGSTGSVNAKLRLLTTDIDAIKASLAVLDNIVSGAGVNISQIGGVAPASTKCDDSSKRLSGTISTSSSGNTELVALTSSQVIYLCDYDIDVVDDTVIQIIYGTGTACATGETDLFTHRFVVSTTDTIGIVKSGGGFQLTKTAASNALCIENSAAVQIDINFTYVKE